MAVPDSKQTRKDALVGTVVNGKYRVHQAIARGGMGRIYYATQEPLDRPVALKVVQADGENEDESQFLKRFLQEASILAKLQHPNVVTLFDYGQIEGSEVEKFFIAMEFLAGETLLNRLKTRGRLDIGETLILGRQMMRGLREAHKRGIVHRDLKPSNIILVPEGDGPEIVKLVDFGIGKVLNHPGDAQDLTQDGVFVGTPRYMAPEQFEGTASPASDLYALGTIMFQAITGQLPFTGSNMSEFMVAKLARTVPTMRETAPDLPIPDSVESLVMHLLQRRPEDRPSMEALHAHFMACDEEVFGSSHGRRRNSSGPHNLSATGSGPYSMLKTGSGQVSAAHGTGSVGSITGPHGGPVSSRQGVPISAPISSAQTTEQMLAPPVGAMDQSGERRLPGGMMPEEMRVPPTVVQSMDLLRAQMTPRPMASSTRPQPPTSGGRTAAFLAIGALVVLLLGSAVYWKARTRTQSGAPDTAAAESSAERAERADRAALAAASAAAAEAAAAKSPAAAGSAFFVTVTSVPPGATVFEGDKTLGTTPLTFSVDRSSVASGPRTFRVEKKGFASSQVIQGDEPSLSKEWTISLTPDAVTAVKSRPPIKPGASTATAAGAAGPTGPGADIRLKR